MDQLRARRVTASEPLESELVEGLADESPGGEDRVSSLQREARDARGTGSASGPAAGGDRALLLRGAIAGGGRRFARGERRRSGIAAFTRTRHAEEVAARRYAIGKPMDLSRFKECSAAFGAERRRWPQRDQALYDRFAQYAGRHGDPRRGRPYRSLPRRARARSTRSCAERTALPRWPCPPGGASARQRRPWRRARCSALSWATCRRTAPLTPVSVAQLLLGPQSLQEIGL